MKMLLKCVLLATACCIGSRADAGTVSFRNSTSGKILVRCISGGNVSPNAEYRREIAPGQSHSRSSFANGMRVVGVWNADRTICACQVISVTDDPQDLTVTEDDGILRISVPCAECESE
ncbi:hypothetical protein Pan189_03200 [Stratiformator vulcanicus]|uniref:Uncharacterized protein n=1 Tax=Stratiformator vulcanicus TaxID=2527980 RepID=A0A517QWC0_9PLAN|nr:hypothetical protein Pan189_03200 [Stratiformator vulcanicus]